jgi:small subunit ribosomal protein S17
MKKKKTESCGDKNCPFHGNLKTRKRTFVGKIIKKDVHGTATIEWKRLFYIPKYERYEKRRTRVRVHNPKCINAKINDIVKVKECRPVSKTKHFVIVEVSK